ncbi:MAG: radical SAM protein [Thermoproteota archaeon]|nr:MAG: radical SAM protein [Candidatus Korarchaeota archaeon]
MIEGRVLRRFDPWHGSLCTCPTKYSLSPYTGCGHSCLYCYISAYIRDPFRPRPKKDFLRNLSKDLTRVKPGQLVSMSNSSDPYTPPEEELMLSRSALKLLLNAGMRVLVVTKSDLVVRDIDVLSKGNSAVSITVTTMDEGLASRLEPGAPSPEMRMKALEKVSSAGIPTILRLDPIIPGLNDSKDSISEVIDRAREAGVKHVVSSTYKARADSLRRLLSSFPELESVRDLYRRGERVGSYMYLPRSMRKAILGRVRSLVLEAGMTFAVCREGMPELNSVGVCCDGSHLTFRGKLLLAPDPCGSDEIGGFGGGNCV